MEACVFVSNSHFPRLIKTISDERVKKKNNAKKKAQLNLALEHLI